MKKIFIIVIIGLIVVAGIIIMRRSKTPASPQVAGNSVYAKAVVHKSPTCGCCSSYISYLKRQGFEVEVENHNDLTSIKEQYGVPSGVESCHTTVIGDYVAEGHIPVASITKMLADRPSIAGIAMPGMPMGAPGMGGAKQGSFTVYGFTKDGEISEFDNQ